MTSGYRAAFGRIGGGTLVTAACFAEPDDAEIYGALYLAGALTQDELAVYDLDGQIVSAAEIDADEGAWVETLSKFS